MIMMETAACPTCGQPGITHIDRPPRETTHEQLMPMWRTFEPGPEATIIFRCGHTLAGEEGLAWLLQVQRDRS